LYGNDTVRYARGDSQHSAVSGVLACIRYADSPRLPEPALVKTFVVVGLAIIGDEQIRLVNLCGLYERELTTVERFIVSGAVT
jgi:hypothetical protein